MKLRKPTAIIALAAMTLSLAACGNNGGNSSTNDTETTESAEKTGENSFKIGFSNCSQDTPFFANMTPIIEDYAKSKDVEVVSLNADNDTTKQNKTKIFKI